MFGEDLLIGKKIVNIDSKNRVYLPAFTKAEENDEIALTNNVDNEGTPYIKLYLLKKYKEIAARLQKLQENATSIAEYMHYEKEIVDICANIDTILKVDKERRILIPHEIMTINNWQKKDNLYCEGKGNYLTLR